MNLSDIRNKIDEIDQKILKLITERNAVIPQVFEYKQKNNIAQFQPWREKEMIESKIKLARELWISEDIIKEIFELLIKESHRIQSKLTIQKNKSVNIFDFKLEKFSKRLALDISIFEIFKRIYANYQNFFILESLTNDRDFSKYSYCWFGPKFIIKARWQKLWIDNEEIKYSEKNPWEFLKLNFPFDLLKWEEWFFWWLVWYNSFESFKYLEPTVEFKENKEFYDFEYWLYLEWLKYDHARNEFTYFSLIWDNSENFISNVNSTVELQWFKVKEMDNKWYYDFKKWVEFFIDHIKKWNIFQVVPALRFDYEVSWSALWFYEKLREVNPSPYMFFLKNEDRQIIWASPELVVSVKWQKIETYPIAGTRSRWKTIEEDRKLEEELLADIKENAEHMMLVDMARNDIGKVCKFGTVKVDKLKTIKKFSHVQHIVSFVSGELRDDKNMFDAFMENFPMGTVSWAPKIEAIKLINEIEKTPRWPYTWWLWYFSFNWDAMMAMIIRSFFIAGNHAYTQAWAWIVLDSKPEYEEKECIKKSMAVRSCL